MKYLLCLTILEEDEEGLDTEEIVIPVVLQEFNTLVSAKLAGEKIMNDLDIDKGF